MTGLNNLMSKKLITISVGATVAEAAEKMKEFRIRHLPVVDDKDGIIGVISSKDYHSFAATPELNVEFVMSSPVVFVEEALPVKDAIYKMLEKKISCLIVSNETDDAVGILTTDDLLWYLVTRLEADEKKEKTSIFSRIFNTDTVGKVADQISMAGI